MLFYVRSLDSIHLPPKEALANDQQTSTRPFRYLPVFIYIVVQRIETFLLLVKIEGTRHHKLFSSIRVTPDIIASIIEDHGKLRMGTVAPIL